MVFKGQLNVLLMHCRSISRCEVETI